MFVFLVTSCPVYVNNNHVMTCCACCSIEAHKHLNMLAMAMQTAAAGAGDPAAQAALLQVVNTAAASQGATQSPGATPSSSHVLLPQQGAYLSPLTSLASSFPAPAMAPAPGMSVMAAGPKYLQAAGQPMFFPGPGGQLLSTAMLPDPSAMQALPPGAQHPLTTKLKPTTDAMTAQRLGIPVKDNKFAPY